MALHKDMKLWEMRQFLQEEVKEQILLEIAPILHVGIAQGGYFGVTRQILCLVDFLGALYSGYNGEVDKKTERKLISKGEKAIKFIEEIMGENDPNYKTNGKYLYLMYRHGLVHLYQPKEIELKDGKKLSWLAYKGPREGTNVLEVQNVKHMGISQSPQDPNTKYLTISIISLYYDLITAIDLFTKKLELEKDLQNKWISTANAISEPEKEEY
ncbi:hypothetical protein HY409_00505 [Candidatus Gottesmanbacteria bacterium]|nr:hypothetical protein [Candidatus Gottesmanbacteria bacterium]